MMLSLDTPYRSFGGEVEASRTPTICRPPDSRRHQLSAIAPHETPSGASRSSLGCGCKPDGPCTAKPTAARLSFVQACERSTRLCQATKHTRLPLAHHP